MNDREPAALLAYAHEWLDETDAIVMRYFGGTVAATAKPDATLVTAADTEVEQRLRERIGEAFPDHGFLGEELGESGGAGEARWVIDPIDATHNFVRGIPIFGTLLALERDGELVLGVASAPAIGQRWSAALGAGARVRFNGGERPIHVSAVERVEEAQLCYASVRNAERSGMLPGLQALVRRSWRDRGFGDFWAHMLVAQGSAEAMFEHGVKPWDLAALAVIVREAGGRLTDLEGRPSWSGPYAVTSNGLLHEQVLEALNEGLPR